MAAIDPGCVKTSGPMWLFKNILEIARLRKIWVWLSRHLFPDFTYSAIIEKQRGAHSLAPLVMSASALNCSCERCTDPSADLCRAFRQHSGLQLLPGRMLERQVAAHGAVLDNASCVQHHNPLAEVVHQAQIVGDQHEGGPLVATQRLEPL